MHVRLLLAGAVSAFFLTGCGKAEPEYVEVQEIEVTPQVEDAHDHASHAGQPHVEEAAQGLGFTYTMPATWTQKVNPNMVLLAFQTGSPPELLADMAVSAFPGDVGGQSANVNRWRRQIGLGPLDPDSAVALIKPLTIAGKEAWQVDLTGPEGAGPDGQAVRMVVSAVFHDGKTWFFKMVGPNSAVEGELVNYAAFIKSVKF